MKLSQVIFTGVALLRGAVASCDGVEANQLIDHLEKYNQHLSDYASLGSKALEATASQSTGVTGNTRFAYNVDAQGNQNIHDLTDLHSKIKASYKELKNHQTQMDALADGCIPLSRKPKVFSELFNMMSTYLVQQRNLIAAGNILAQQPPHQHKRDADAWPAEPTFPTTTTSSSGSVTSTISIAWEINGTPISELTAKNTDTPTSTASSTSSQPSTTIAWQTSATTSKAAGWDDASDGSGSGTNTDSSSVDSDSTPTSQTSSSKKPNIFQRIINGTEGLLKDALHLVERILRIGDLSSDTMNISALASHVASRYNIQM